MSKSTAKQAPCILEAVDKRLRDLHRQWHDAEQAYFDPDHFRVAIQTAIQTARTVTFILQSNKSSIPGFDAWYQSWREKLDADPLMRWMVDARNKIEKRGDLEAKSFIRAEIVASYLNEGPTVEVDADLFESPQELLAKIPRKVFFEHVSKHGSLRVQRKWIENSLPDVELLEAVAAAYGTLSDLVRDAHRQAGMAIPNIDDTNDLHEFPRNGGRLPCMIGHSDLRTLTLSLASGAPLSVDSTSIELDLVDAETNAKKYGIKPGTLFDSKYDLEAQLKQIFATARRMIVKDGHHLTIMFFFKERELVQVSRLNLEDQAQKYLALRTLADDVKRTGADAAILVGEQWRAKADSNRPYMRAHEAADRRELISATLVSKSGEPFQLSALMSRPRWSKKKVTLGNTFEERGGAFFIFAPLYEAWGRAIPDEWTATVKQMNPQSGPQS